MDAKMYSKMPTEFFFLALDGQLLRNIGLCSHVSNLRESAGTIMSTVKQQDCSITKEHFSTDMLITHILPPNAFRRDRNGKCIE